MVRSYLALVCAVLATMASGARTGQPHVATAGQLLISEFRLSGPNGATDEFIEIYNASGADHTVAAADGSGYGIAASDGKTRCTIPNGTVMPDGGHFLCANSAGYSLGPYPAGSATTATPDATYTLDIPDNAGIAIFNNNSGGGDYFLKNRLDAVGSTAEPDTLYREGKGYPAVTPVGSDGSFVRRVAGGCTGSIDGNCHGVLLMQTTPGLGGGLLDTHSNGNDFIFVNNSGLDAGAGSRLGAPGPENLLAPVTLDGTVNLTSKPLDGCRSELDPANAIRDSTSDGLNNSTYGTLDLMRTWVNGTGTPLTRVRFRIVDLSTFPAATGVAELRARSSSDEVTPVHAGSCLNSGGSFLAVARGTTVESPPFQGFGGGYNSTLSVAAIAPGTPLANGTSIGVHFLLGVEQKGVARFCVIPETQPASIGLPFCFIGNTETDTQPVTGDFDFDRVADLTFYNRATGQWTFVRSSSGFTTQTSITWGGPDDTPVPGDYDGDGRIDPAVYDRPAAMWHVLTSSSNYTRSYDQLLGGNLYLPASGDYDGDGAADFGTVTIDSGGTETWIAQLSTGGIIGTEFPVTGVGWTAVPMQDFDGDRRTDWTVYNAGTGQWIVLTSSTNWSTIVKQSWGGPGYSLVAGDYDGDGKSDFAVYNRRTGDWNILKSSSGYTSAMTVSLGGPGFLPVPADYDGDGKMDVAVYQPATQRWTALTSSSGYTASLQMTAGAPGDMPISTAVLPIATREHQSGDFDGEFVSDITVYDTSTGVWSTMWSHSYYDRFARLMTTAWGGTGFTPVPGDYDGDGRTDVAVYQESTGQWYVLKSSSGFTSIYSFNCGGPGYTPVAADYDGDGRADMIVYNSTTGLWYGLKSSSNFTTTLSVSWGGIGFTAAPGDFDADGKADLAVYQAATGNWYILNSSTNYTTSTSRNFGGAGYVPIEADFDGDGITDFAVYQVSTGLWTVLKSSTANTQGFSVSYGGPGYTPVAGDYDDDGCADVAVYNTATGDWSILLSGSGFTASLVRHLGGPGSVPLPAFQ